MHEMPCDAPTQSYSVCERSITLPFFLFFIPPVQRHRKPPMLQLTQDEKWVMQKLDLGYS